MADAVAKDNKFFLVENRINLINYDAQPGIDVRARENISFLVEIENEAYSTDYGRPLTPESETTCHFLVENR